MRTGKRFLFLGGVAIALMCAGVSPVRAEESAAFVRANQDFSEGRFKEAADGYQELVRSGQFSATLFYDLRICIWRVIRRARWS